jgi:hypothetical protein
MAFRPEKDRKLRQILNRWKRFVMEGNEKKKETEQKTKMDGKSVEEITASVVEDEGKGREKTEVGKAKEANPNTDPSGYVGQLSATDCLLFANPQVLNI